MDEDGLGSAESNTGYLDSRQQRKLGLDLALCTRDQSIARRNQDHLAISAMLSLRKKISRDECRHGIVICKDEDLRRSGGHVDRDISRDDLLGGGDIAVAWTEYFID